MFEALLWELEAVNAADVVEAIVCCSPVSCFVDQHLSMAVIVHECACLIEVGGWNQLDLEEDGSDFLWWKEDAVVEEIEVECIEAYENIVVWWWLDHELANGVVLVAVCDFQVVLDVSLDWYDLIDLVFFKDLNEEF